MGACFTAGQDEPSPGKEALIQRTVCLQARAETEDDSAHEAFMRGLHFPDVAKRVSDFRLSTSLTGYVLLAIKDLPWLQPDMAIANLVFKEGDKMLQEKYGLPKPEPRRLVKRLNNLKTVRHWSLSSLLARYSPSPLWLQMCVQEAVARVYFFKQVRPLALCTRTLALAVPRHLWPPADQHRFC